MDETRLAEIEAVTNDLINRRAQADYDEAAWDAEISFDTVLELIAALREAWAERDDARTAHAELMQAAGEKYEGLRDRARTAATELSEKNKRLAADRDRLAAQIERVKELVGDADPDGTDMWAHIHVEAIRAALDGD